MKNIFSIFSIGNLIDSFKKVATRFPVALTIIFVTGIVVLSLIHGDFSNLVEDNLIRGVFSLIITFFLSIGVTLCNESCNNGKLAKGLTQFLVIIFGILFYIGFKENLDNFENIVFFCLTLAGIISFLFFSPYTKKLVSNNIKSSVYYTYFYNISVVFLTSFILGFVLFVLGYIGISTVFSLFDLDFLNNSEIYGDWSVISLIFITPIYALSKLPSKKSFTENHFNENIFFSFLIKYIAIPFIYIYFIILYAYTVKVLLSFGDWPKGEVSWMVIGFSIFGYITYIFSYIFEQKNKFISTFRKAFPYVVIPQIFMLAYAIYLRIAQYDVTVNRYFVVIFGIWLLIISLYYIFSKTKKLSFIVSTLTLFTIIISIGPWSVYSLPETRQFERLKVNLETAGILVNGEIKPLEKYTQIDKDLSKNIYSGIDYVCEYNNCESIKFLFKNEYEELAKEDKENWEKSKKSEIKEIKEKYKFDEEKQKSQIEIIESRKYNPPSRWEIVYGITQKIKVDNYYIDREPNQITLRIKDQSNIFPIDIKNYSKIYRIKNYVSDTNKSYAKYDEVNREINIYENKEKVKTINLNSFVEKLENNNKGLRNKDVLEKDLTFIGDNYKVIFTELTIENIDSDKTDEEYNYYYHEGYILLK